MYTEKLIVSRFFKMLPLSEIKSLLQLLQFCLSLFFKTSKILNIQSFGIS